MKLLSTFDSAAWASFHTAGDSKQSFKAQFFEEINF
jgi:hypothetical protein